MNNWIRFAIMTILCLLIGAGFHFLLGIFLNNYHILNNKEYIRYKVLMQSIGRHNDIVEKYQEYYQSVEKLMDEYHRAHPEVLYTLEYHKYRNARKKLENLTNDGNNQGKRISNKE